jgi:restriction system protein
MTPDSLSPPRRFVGRANELEAMAAHLLGESTEGADGQVLVHGAAGAGKTALVAEFAQRHMAEFPGGIHYLPSLADLDTPEEARHAAEITSDHFEPRSPALVVVEEISDANPVAASEFVQELRRRRPRARIVFTSQMALEMPNGWLSLALGGLSDSEMWTLLQERGLGTGELSVLLAQAKGNPLLATTIAELASRGEGLEQLLARLEPTTYSGLLGPDGRPLNPGEQPPESVGVQLRSANADLLARIRQDPDHVYSLSSREFEEFVAALYEKHGFEVELTPASRDGGVDLYAVRYEPYGKVLTVVECKQNSPHRPVGVEMVRSLHGAVEDKGASVGVLATTSSFTAGAKALQQRHRFRLALQDWFDLQDMLD